MTDEEQLERDYRAEAYLQKMKEDPYSFLDILEEDPKKRVAQIQQCRMGMLRAGYKFTNEEQRLLKDISSTDLTMLRLDVESDSSDALRQFAATIGQVLSGVSAPVRPTSEMELTDTAPRLAFDDLDEIPDESLSTDFPEIGYDDVNGPQSTKE